jgi:hypothetical protein
MLRRCCTISRIYSPVSITHCNAKVDGQISTHQPVINSSPTNLMMDMMVKPLESPSQQTKPTVPWCFIAHLNVVQFFHTSCMIEITMVLICFNPLNSETHIRILFQNSDCNPVFRIWSSIHKTRDIHSP